ncbi:hypothetical protein PVAND_003620 [Polypedilum vanderplanki]|uniref:Uncharacterized protein n=1 Tax=Polypedilum vanderplanki TaxID=319348 RepID=A0A9J6BUL6_POLVA|nr:hypothetical protein PVAND_003620 [Polypedilum vanderplanki]
MKIKLEKSDEKLKEEKLVNKIYKVHRKTSEKSKKIRPLAKKNKDNHENLKSASIIDKKRIYLLSFLLLVFAAVLYQIKFGSCEFWNAYNKNFNRIVYGDEHYCDRNIDASFLRKKLQEQVTNQEDAIQLIEGSLKLANEESFIQIIFNGMIGVGKTLSSQIIAENFQWQRNVQKFIWNYHQPEFIFNNFKDKISNCGFNLIIIDDLELSDESIKFVIKFEEELRYYAKRESYRIAVIIIFKQSLSEEYREKISNFVIIDFNSFKTQSDLIDCIELHRRKYNIQIQATEMDELKEINFTASGCKQVPKRLNLVS